MDNCICKVVEGKISIDELFHFVSQKNYGAVLIFTGTVRDMNKGKNVISINYSAFREMTEKEFYKICDEAFQKWQPCKIAIAHRIGRLLPGDISLAIAVSTTHRNEAYEVSRFILEKIKHLAPVWKEEFYDDGKKWISTGCSDSLEK